MINFEIESLKVADKLKQVSGYLECENVVIRNIKQLVVAGNGVPNIEVYLKKLLSYFENQMGQNTNYKDSINYLHAATFVRTLITTPYWHSWISTIE